MQDPLQLYPSLRVTEKENQKGPTLSGPTARMPLPRYRLSPPPPDRLSLLDLRSLPAPGRSRHWKVLQVGAQQLQVSRLP